jgi:hypothetical protein
LQKNLKSHSNYKNLFYTISIQLVLFLFFYNIPLHLFNIPFSSGKLISISAIIYLSAILLIKKVWQIKISKEYLYYLVGIFVVFLISFVLLKIVYNTQDDYYLNVLFFYIIEYLLGAYFVVTLFKLYSLEKLIKNLINLAVIQSLIMIGSLFIPPLKKIVVDVMEANPQFVLFSKAETIKDSFRGLALASDRTLGMSVFFSISLMLIYLYISLRQPKFNYTKFTLFFVLIFCGGLLAARTFFIGLFLGLFFLAHLVRRNPHISNSLKKYSRIILLTFIFITISTPIIINFFFSDIKEEIDLAFNWMFEIFINSDAEGFAKSESLYDLVYNNLTVLPSNWQTFLIGDPNRTFQNGIHYMGILTDSGYLRMLFVYGVIGSLSIYLFWIFVFIRTAKLFTRNEGVKYLLFFIAIILFVVQIKYDVFPGSSLNFKLLLIFFVLGVERKKQQTNMK